MKVPAVFLVLLFLSGLWSDITRISRKNQWKREAETAFNNKQYKIAAKAWEKVLNESKDPDPVVRLNLAHAYYRQNETLKAAREYQQVIRTAQPHLKSVAQQQLGNQMAGSGELEAALQMYKQALKSNPKNRQARYNFELLLKKIKNEIEENKEKSGNKNQETSSSEKKESENQQQDDPGPGAGGGEMNNNNSGFGRSGSGMQKEINQGRDKGNEAGENLSEDAGVDSKSGNTNNAGNFPGADATTNQKLHQINMPEERAKIILNAMRDAERQYLQQLPRKQRSRQQSGKPDW